MLQFPRLLVLGLALITVATAVIATNETRSWPSSPHPTWKKNLERDWHSLWRKALPFFSRSQILFENETNDHRFDLAYRMSLRTAETRAESEMGLILLERLPRGKSIEETATKLVAGYRFGSRTLDRGILIVYSEAENHLKIAVTPGLERALPPDIRERYEDAARTYMLSDLPQEFLTKLITDLSAIAHEGRLFPHQPPQPPDWYSDNILTVGASAKARQSLELKDLIQSVKQLPASEFVTYAPLKSVRATINRYLFSLANGIGDPQLPLLTEGSKLLRALVPRTGEQQKRTEKSYRRAGSRQFEIEGDFGLVVFKPGLPNAPIVLRRQPNGTWLVDEVRAQAYFYRFDDSPDFYPKYDDLPVRNALLRTNHPNAQKPVYRNRVRTPSPNLADLGTEVVRLENAAAQSPRSALAQARLGEFYLFELYWLTRAKKHFDRAARLEPSNPDYHWRLYDLALNLQMVEEALLHLETLRRLLPEDREVQSWLQYYKAQYNFDSN
jgi:tetratricopeptide (TPR) repeat protein